MSTESNAQQQPETAPERRKKFVVRIMVAKKEIPSKKSQSTDTILRSEPKQKNHLGEIQQHKTKLKALTKTAIEELERHQAMRKKAAVSCNDNSNNAPELDYELTNLKMIKKILALSTPFEAVQSTPKNKTNTRKKHTASKAARESKRNGREKNESIKILIVEDDRTTIKIISHLLEQHDYKVGFAMDAEDGLKQAIKDRPDLILLDIMLPGMDGLQLLSKLQASDATQRIPVVVLSSLSGEKDILKGLEKGATDYILKPFSPQILFFKIKKILSLKNEHFANNRHL